MKMARTFVMLLIGSGLTASVGFAGSIVSLTFEGLAHGQIVSMVDGIGISAHNNSGPDIAAIFDSLQTGTRDPDLEYHGSWSGGNLETTELGNLLFISENSRETGGILDNPDDEGDRPAGFLQFVFPDPINLFGFDLVDVESIAAGEEPGRLEFFDGAALVHTVSFMDFGSDIAYGNNTANRVHAFDVPSSTRVRIQLGGSGAVDNITYSTPEPGTVLLIGLGLAAVAVLRRRRC